MQLGEVELKPINMHWLDGDPHDDLCVHGGIYLKFGNNIVSGGEADWTLSTAAFRLLKTLTEEHSLNMDEALIPCCGFDMYPVESAPDGLYIPNCGNGIDWSIHHPEPGIVGHTFATGEIYYTAHGAWASEVCCFSDLVYEFFKTAWPKNSSGDEERERFEMFMRLWKERRNAADRFNAGRDAD
jgi:hypothetical protein